MKEIRTYYLSIVKYTLLKYMLSVMFIIPILQFVDDHFHLNTFKLNKYLTFQINNFWNL